MDRTRLGCAAASTPFRADRAQPSFAGRGWRFAIVGACALVTSCTSSSAAGSAASVGDHPSSVADQAEQSNSTEGGAEPTSNDFEAFFWPDSADEHAFTIQLETAIANCMRERGFDYVSDAAASGSGGQSVDSAELGYGVVDSYLAGQATESPTRSALLEYLDTLGDVERQQYERALSGDPADPTTIGDSCRQTASSEAAASIPRFQAAYQSILDEYYTRLATDPRMVVAMEAWVMCVEESTGLLAATASPLNLSRSNIEYAVRAEIAGRLGRSIRWVTEAEADQLDTTTLDQPVEVSVDESGIGLLVYGPITKLDSVTIVAARSREQVIFTESESCWAQSGGPSAISELQVDAMAQAEPLIASANP